MDTASTETVDLTWNGLYRAGGAAALVAGVIFRRNLSAELSLLGVRAPGSVGDWFGLLQSNRLLGLTLLNVFDVVDYALVGLMFLALWAALRRAGKSAPAVAAACGLAGVAVYFASNTAFSMLSLSGQYASATTDAQRSLLLAAGQAMLAINEGSGAYLSLLLLAIAGLLFSIVMLRSGLFGRGTAYVGILASALDLAYCTVLAFVPAIDGDLIAICTLPAAGLLLMIWHILIGLRLLRLGRLESVALPR
jgi:hypothetical protein